MDSNPPPPVKYPTVGMSSRNLAGGHALFFDWDGITGPEAARTAFLAQVKHGLGDIALFHSGGGVHGVCSDLYSIRQATRILATTPLIDEQHVNIGRKLGRWILRTGPKAEKPAPRYLSTVETNPATVTRPNGASLAHARYLAPFGVPIPHDARGSPDLILNHYRTTKA